MPVLVVMQFRGSWPGEKRTACDVDETMEENGCAIDWFVGLGHMTQTAQSSGQLVHTVCGQRWAPTPPG